MPEHPDIRIGNAERSEALDMGLTPLVALVSFFMFDTWLFFLLIPAVGVVLFAGRDRDGHSTDSWGTDTRRDEKKNA